MTGVVYKIIFPDGSFYIGATSNFHARIRQHYRKPSILIEDKINYFTLTLSEFESLFEIIDDYNEDYFFLEKKRIWESKDDFFCLNKSIPKVNPFLPKDLYLKEVKSLEKTSTIKVSKETKEKLDKLLKYLGLKTHDALLNRLMDEVKFELRRKDNA